MRLTRLTMILFGAACGAGTAPRYEWVYGTWRWTESCGGLGYHCLTPATEGYREVLQLDPAGTYIRLRNGVVVDHGMFQITPEGDSVSFQLRLDGGEPLAGRLTGDTLRLNEGCCDRFEHRYVRP